MVDGSNASTFPQYSLAQAGLYPDLSQWSNPYSSFNASGQMPGWPTQYSGTPVQAATGSPIAGYQPPMPQSMGTTLNSMPQSRPNIPQFLPTGGGQATGGAAGGENAGMGGATGGTNFNPGYQINPAYAAAQQSQQPSPMGSATQPSGYQNALNALANPGTPAMTGAGYNPMTQTGLANQQVGQSVLNNFLQSGQMGGMNRPAAPGIGGGSSGVTMAGNPSFMSALQGLKTG
jgi:hypothetical protein